MNIKRFISSNKETIVTLSLSVLLWLCALLSIAVIDRTAYSDDSALLNTADRHVRQYCRTIVYPDLSE